MLPQVDGGLVTGGDGRKKLKTEFFEAFEQRISESVLFCGLKEMSFHCMTLFCGLSGLISRSYAPL
ncbi:hypothetical protein Hanom_Chr01g00069031 [Helianthus anomalus]